MNGTLVIDKPAGLTSHDVVARVRRIVGERRVGHTGTLDPFATGVLVVLVGRATRLLQFISGAEKEYEAVIRFGYATDTGDATGARITADSDQRVLRDADIEPAMASLRGEINQIPPMHSAKKIKGQKLYELARRGEEVERQPVKVRIDSFHPIEIDGRLLHAGADHTIDLKAHVVCSAGTYVRTLAEDLGKQLGVSAHLATLRRTRAGRFGIDTAITLERLAELTRTDSIRDQMISLDATVGHLPAVVLNESDVKQVINGREIAMDSDHQDGQRVRLQNVAGELIAVGVYDAERRIIHADVVLGC